MVKINKVSDIKNLNEELNELVKDDTVSFENIKYFIIDTLENNKVFKNKYKLLFGKKDLVLDIDKIKSIRKSKLLDDYLFLNEIGHFKRDEIGTKYKFFHKKIK